MIVTLGGIRFATAPVAVEGVKFKFQNLRGWWSQNIRTDVEDMPQDDGGFDAEQSYRGSKAMGLEGLVLATSAEEAEDAGWLVLNGLAPNGERLEMKVETSVRTFYMNVRLTSIVVEPFTDRRARFQVGLIAHDPRKYGDLPADEDLPTAVPSGGAGDGLEWPLMGDEDTGTLSFGAFSPTGLVSLYNGGTAPSWPSWRVRGGLDSSGFQIVSGTHVIEFAAAVPAGQELLLSPFAGGRAVLGGVDVTGASLTRSEWVAVQPGETRLFSFDPLGVADANARLIAEFREAWW